MMIGFQTIIIGFQTIIIGLQGDMISANRKIMEDIQYRVKEIDYRTSVNKEDDDEILKKINWLAICSLIILLTILYQDIIFGNWKISYTNLAYYFQPFNSHNVKIKWPLLSDVADNFYPILLILLSTASNGVYGYPLLD